MKTLRETFLDGLKTIYDAEFQIVDVMPRLVDGAEHEDLREVLQAHLDESQGHVGRLEKVFGTLQEPPRRKKCKGIEGLLVEAVERVDQDLGDAALIGALQQIEHYEISAYGTLASWANLLGEDDAVDLLDETLTEENNADNQLTDLTESIITPGEEHEVEHG